LEVGHFGKLAWEVNIGLGKVTLYLTICSSYNFWLSQDSNLTPPVCLAAFAAAAIAKTDPIKTGFESWKVGKGLYIIPLLFAFSPIITGRLDWEDLEGFQYVAMVWE